MFDDDFDAEVPKPEAAVGAANPNNSRKRRATGQRKNHVTSDDASCHAEKCEEPRLVAKRWCSKHNRAWDNMWMQAKKAGETGALTESCSTPSRAQDVMDEYELNNPEHSKFQKKHVIQWGTFKKRHKISQVYRSRKGCRPFEYKQWLKRGSNEMGWSDAESKAQWKKWQSSNVDRDHDGLDKQLRLWIPVIEEKHWDQQRAKEWEMEEGGDVEKDFSAKGDLKNALVNHLSAASSSSMDGDRFLNGQDLKDTGGLRLGADGEDEADPPTTPVKPSDRGDPAALERQTPEDRF